MARHWTKRERRTLLQGASVNGLAWFATRTGDSHDWPNAPKGRSRHSIYAQASRSHGAGGLTRGAYTLRRVCEITGYATTQIRRAQAALGQKWKKTGRHGSYLIRDEQLKEIAQWLQNDYWCKHLRLYNCLWCGTEDREHYSGGLCRSCHQRYKTRLNHCGLPGRRHDLLAVVRRWLRRLRTVAMAGMERQLIRKRALTEQMLRQLIQLETA